MIDKETIIKIIPLTIIGLFIAAYDYYICYMWSKLYERTYYCIKTSDGINQICQFWFELDPRPFFIFTAIGILVTSWYASTILTYIIPHQD